MWVRRSTFFAAAAAAAAASALPTAGAEKFALPGPRPAVDPRGRSTGAERQEAPGDRPGPGGCEGCEAPLHTALQPPGTAAAPA